MIEGFKLDFTSDQLREHIQKRYLYHVEQEAFYKRQLNDRLRHVRENKSDPIVFASIIENPTEFLASRHKNHFAKCEMFIMMRDHSIPGETYRLLPEDLVLLELIDVDLDN